LIFSRLHSGLAHVVGYRYISAVTHRQLARYLGRLGISVRQAADRLEIDRSHLYRVLRGEYPVPGPVARAVEAWVEIAALEAELAAHNGASSDAA